MRKLKNQFKAAELKISYKAAIHPTAITSEKDAEQFFYAIWDKKLINLQEQFYVLYLNQASEVICWRCLHTGAITSSVIDMRLLFGVAFGCCATRIIIAHNHPAGQLNPSQLDYNLTHRIKQAGKLLEVPLADHLIIAGGKSVSFYATGLMER